MLKTRTLFLPLLAAALGGCWMPLGPASPAKEGGRAVAAPIVEVKESPSRPRIAQLAREGDPSAALALAVATDGGAAVATALASVVSSRLEQRGFARVTTQAARDGYRVQVLVADPGEAAAVVLALREALLTPLSPGSPEILRASERLETLRGKALEDPAREPIARCTGRLVLLPNEPAPNPLQPDGLSALEAFRRGSHVTSRLAFGVVGPRKVGDSATMALGSSQAWPAGPPPREPWPTRDEARAYATTAQTTDEARVTVALRVADARDAMWAAERAGRMDGPLASKLASLPAATRLAEVSATTRPRGGCLLATVELEHPLGDGKDRAAAAAALVVERELRAELAEAATLAEAPDPWRSVLEASDPRDAADLAAWWSLASPAPQAEAPLRAATVAELPGGDVARFSNLLAEADRSLEPRRIEQRVRVEVGQSRLFMLLGSPCGLASESSADAGITALALLAAAASDRGGSNGVILEPWLSSEGIGLLAHASRHPKESAEELAARVANEAARALVLTASSAPGFPKARSTLLARLANENGKEGSPLEVVAEALAPTHLSWIAPFGSFDSAARQGAEAVALRTDALLQGPLRVAVLADQAETQADKAAHVARRWLSENANGERACSRPSTRLEPIAGLVEVELPPSLRSSRALIAFPAKGLDASERPSFELTVAALNGDDGFLAQALRSLPGASATARRVGGDIAPALLVDLRAPNASLDAAVAQARGLFARLAEGAVTGDDWAHATRKLRDSELTASLDPRRRIVDLWLGRNASYPKEPPSLESWQAFTRTILREDKAVLVLARPKS